MCVGVWVGVNVGVGVGVCVGVKVGVGVEVGMETRIEPSCMSPSTSLLSVSKNVAGESGQNVMSVVAPQHASPLDTVRPIRINSPSGIARNGKSRSARTMSIFRSDSSGAGATCVLSNSGGRVMRTESGIPSESSSDGSKLRQESS